MSQRVRFKTRIYSRAWREMLLMLAKHSDHHRADLDDCTFDTEEDVRRYLDSQGVGFDRLIEACRDFSIRQIPFFEVITLASPGWQVGGEAPSPSSIGKQVALTFLSRDLARLGFLTTGRNSILPYRHGTVLFTWLRKATCTRPSCMELPVSRAT